MIMQQYRIAGFYWRGSRGFQEFSARMTLWSPRPRSLIVTWQQTVRKTEGDPPCCLFTEDIRINVFLIGEKLNMKEDIAALQQHPGSACLHVYGIEMFPAQSQTLVAPVIKTTKRVLWMCEPAFGSTVECCGVGRNRGHRDCPLVLQRERGWVGGVGKETADHLNCPVGKAAAGWRAINRWWEGEDTVDGHSNRLPRWQRSHMGFRNSWWGMDEGDEWKYIQIKVKWQQWRCNLKVQ